MDYLARTVAGLWTISGRFQEHSSDQAAGEEREGEGKRPGKQMEGK